MKNIFILPTAQPSRLAFDIDDEFYLLSEDPVFFKHQDEVENRNIYITSDEEIKDKDYVLSDTSIGALYLDGEMNTSSMLAEGQWKKVILTTDPALIEDGVQAIDDEFLEWFVKNSSCEFVEVNFSVKWHPSVFGGDELIVKYNIIIPQEEPNLENLESISSTELSPEFQQLVNDNWDYLIGDELKLETLEEVLPKNSNGKYSRNEIEKAFESGAKWQAERMYNEEEVKDILIRSKTACYSSIIEWFEQNEKK